MIDKKGVLIDTCFLIHLLDDGKEFHNNALGYWDYFLDNDYILYISTIAIAEYCVKGEITDLPLDQVRVLPFNLNHARVAGDFADAAFRGRRSAANQGENTPRAIVPNDSKMFAQAHEEESIGIYATSDEKSQRVYGHIRNESAEAIMFSFYNIRQPHTEVFGLLDFGT